VSITARLRDSQVPVPGKDPFTADGITQVYSIATAQVATLTGVPLAEPYLQLVDGQPGGLGVIGLPQPDAGPFLSYGIQWIAFGIIAPILFGYFAFSEVRARRAEKQSAPSQPPTPGKPAAPQTTDEKLADRYGRRR
jgi:cytochrome oxidase assembly protein ShyY1